jgi:molybdenum cofactor cytidylyltransferase
VTKLDDIAVVLLAAGLSRRYGEGEKLLAPLAGKPLAFHVAETLAAMPFHRRLAVCKEAGDELGRGLAGFGFQVLVNPEPEIGQGRSLALGAKAAVGARALVVCLADMPYVTRGDVEALVEAWRADPERPVGSKAGEYFGVPAIFPAPAFVALMELSGDHGARGLLQGAGAVAMDARHLQDFDRVEDFG